MPIQLHNRGSVDPIDAVLSPAFLVATLVMTGAATFSIFGYNLSMSLWSGSGATVSLAFVVAIVSLGAAYLSNEPTLTGRDAWETYLLGGMAVLMLGTAFVPIVRDTVLGSDVLALPVVMVQAAGWAIIAYY